ncbi:putative small heat shock protein HSP20 [Medicago truncatula]|uniref:Putative small heat shock protein HSP20 n=1 Tax=Medicago truncatula TaxID=3880 RepID=A0A396GMK7_MEDTR|nr:putative small heat shock protein HSP20 [Medicago truncatula]
MIGVLQISGERSLEKEDKNDKWHRVERSSGKFVKRLRSLKLRQFISLVKHKNEFYVRMEFFTLF